MPVDVKEVKRRLLVFLKDENLVSEYIRRFGPTIDIKNIKLIKENESTDAVKEGDGPSEGADPIFESLLICPVCNKDNIVSYELKAKSQQVVENRLLQQEYLGAMGHKSVDYDNLAVSICPRCLFASPDRKDFSSISKITGKPVPTQIPQNPILTLQEKIGERKSLVAGIANPEDFFKRPRKPDASILSYKLAGMRANVEAYHELPNSLYKLGFYYIKMAKLIKRKGEDDSAALRDALGYFEECFKNSNSSGEATEYKVLYMIIALNIRLKEDRKAQPFIAAFDKIRTELAAKSKTDPKINLSSVDMWLNKAKNIWEDRERNDLWN
ncbi:MAG: DUF2225 domain-containing protein [Fibrobacteres bacterium]|nr:DUF2225 domain-containing protein [Fibrobacterota bacterium]